MTPAPPPPPRPEGVEDTGRPPRTEQERFEMAERSKVMIGRTPGRNGPGPLWWRLTVYVGDTREDIDTALDEALRLDERLRAR